MKMRLVDGTGIVLAPATTLRLLGDTTAGKRGFGASGLRAVILDGEASFDVVHDPARPFEVRTVYGTARDLGTEFVVASFRETEMRVAVRSGIVALHRLATGASNPRTGRQAAGGIAAASDSTPLVTLQPGDMARLDPTGTVTLTRGTDIGPYFAWTEGTLVFRGAPLAEVATVLARWYGLEIVVADSVLNTRRVTATFEDAPAERMLQLLEIVLAIRADRSGRLITLRSK
jgi:transmembrane sensor